MATSDASICTMALSHLGVGTELATLATESSREAQACRRFYEPTRDEVLRAFAWPFTTTFVALALVEEDPTDEWAYSYRYPTEALTIRRLLSGSRVDTRDMRVHYRLARDTTGRLIYTDLEDAECEYSALVTDPAQFDPLFVIALSYLLAVRIGPRVAGDQPAMADRCYALYLRAMREAQAMALNEERPDDEPDAEYITIRGG